MVDDDLDPEEPTFPHDGLLIDGVLYRRFDARCVRRSCGNYGEILTIIAPVENQRVFCGSCARAISDVALTPDLEEAADAAAKADSST